MGEIPWQASRRSVVLKKKKKREGGASLGMVQKPFPFVWELGKQQGEAKRQRTNYEDIEDASRIGICRRS